MLKILIPAHTHTHTHTHTYRIECTHMSTNGKIATTGNHVQRCKCYIHSLGFRHKLALLCFSSAYVYASISNFSLDLVIGRAKKSPVQHLVQWKPRGSFPPLDVIKNANPSDFLLVVTLSKCPPVSPSPFFWIRGGGGRNSGVNWGIWMNLNDINLFNPLVPRAQK